MTLKQKTLKFNGNKIHFAQIGPTGHWYIPAKLLGLALGYSGEGQKLVDHLGDWKLQKDTSKAGFELWTVNGELLAQIKKDTPEFGVPSSASSATFLTIQGVTKVLLRSRAKLAAEFRTFLVKNAGEVLPTDLREVLGADGSSKKAPTQTKLALPTPSRQGAIQELMTVLEKGKELKLFSTQELKAVFNTLKDSFLSGALKQQEAKTLAMFPQTIQVAPPAVVTKDATQMVPVSNVQASSLTPNFTSIRGFFLTGHQKHPLYQDWLSAEEIGNLCGKTPDQVKTFVVNYARNNGRELANNQAKDAIVKAGGYFEGVASLVDSHRLPIFVDDAIGCMTTWYFMEDGMLVWRNYWSPEAVKDILKLVESTPTKRAPTVDAPVLPLPKAEPRLDEVDKGWTQFDKDQKAKLEGATKNGKPDNAS